MDKIVHYVFGPYKRKRVLERFVVEELKMLFNKICEEKGFELISQNILIEHVHLLIKKRSSDSNEYVMKMIKGISSREFFKKRPTNRLIYRKLWARGYRAEEIKDEEHLKNVLEYVKGQKRKGVDKRIHEIGNRDV
ncbi:IS200/IS605 family transposase [Candidatus Margulisiibacteriota bacterium]